MQFKGAQLPQHFGLSEIHRPDRGAPDRHLALWASNRFIVCCMQIRSQFREVLHESLANLQLLPPIDSFLGGHKYYYGIARGFSPLVIAPPNLTLRRECCGKVLLGKEFGYLRLRSLCTGCHEYATARLSHSSSTKHHTF